MIPPKAIKKLTFVNPRLKSSLWASPKGAFSSLCFIYNMPGFKKSPMGTIRGIVQQQYHPVENELIMFFRHHLNRSILT